MAGSWLRQAGCAAWRSSKAGSTPPPNCRRVRLTWPATTTRRTKPRALRLQQALACTYRIGFGSRVAQKVLRVQGAMPISDISLRSTVRCAADDSQALVAANPRSQHPAGAGAVPGRQWAREGRLNFVCSAPSPPLRANHLVRRPWSIRHEHDQLRCQEAARRQRVERL